jgi:hypothetical protein
MVDQIFNLLVLALPVACVAWTVTHEEVTREPREWLQQRSKSASSWWARKFFYMWTCEYCFSHYVAAATVWLFGFTLLLDDWRGYLVSWLAVVAVANVYMSLYGHLRVETKKERSLAEQIQASMNENDNSTERNKL